MVNPFEMTVIYRSIQFFSFKKLYYRDITTIMSIRTSAALGINSSLRMVPTHLTAVALWMSSSIGSDSCEGSRSSTGCRLDMRVSSSSLEAESWKQSNTTSPVVGCTPWKQRQI